MLGGSNEGVLLGGILGHPSHTAESHLDHVPDRTRNNATHACEGSHGKPRSTNHPPGFPSALADNNANVLQFCSLAPSCHTSATVQPERFYYIQNIMLALQFRGLPLRVDELWGLSVSPLV